MLQHRKMLENNQPRQIVLPYDRILQPAGTQIYFGDTALEYHALDCALSPNEKWLAVEERFTVFFIKKENLKICYTIIFGDSLSGSMNTYSGIRWYQKKDGLYVFWSTVDKKHRTYVVMAKWNGTDAKISKLFEYKVRENAVKASPNSPFDRDEIALPNGLFVQNENNKDFLYVALNGNNQLEKRDIGTGERVWVQKTGVAPYGIAFAKGKLYVTNWAGRIPEVNDKNVAGVPWGLARIDSTTAAVREGSVSVYDPYTGKLLKQILTGLHPNEIVADKAGDYIYLTNSNSDNVSVINANTDEISENISLRIESKTNPYFGDSQNGWDHVSAYRTVALVASPYTKRTQTINDSYNNPSMVRTIEQMLGLPPMNIQDAIANPMFSCFNDQYNDTPYNALNNNIKLDEMNPPLWALQGKALYYAKQSLDPQFDGIDTGNDDMLNRIIWFAARGTQPYPLKNAGKDSD